MRIKCFLAVLLVFGVLFAFCACEEPEQKPAETPVPTEPEITAPTEDGKIDYTVKVVDENGTPVANVTVQICDEGTCFAPLMTDAEGVAVFRLVESENYKATFTIVPEGSVAEVTDVYFEDTTEATLVLKAA